MYICVRVYLCLYFFTLLLSTTTSTSNCLIYSSFITRVLSGFFHFIYFSSSDFFLSIYARIICLWNLEFNNVKEILLRCLLVLHLVYIAEIFIHSKNRVFFPCESFSRILILFFRMDVLHCWLGLFLIIFIIVEIVSENFFPTRKKMQTCACTHTHTLTHICVYMYLPRLGFIF